MIEIKNLVKQYGTKRAVDNISFTVDNGEILGFLGPNGAGKTTTMNIITGYISSSDGTVTIDGYDILEQPNEAKKQIGYLPENPPLYMDMTVFEYLSFVYDLKKIKGNKQDHIASIMDMVQITDVQGRRIGNLSKGYKQRVGLAQALLGDPKVLILDEPTVGLDPKQIIDIRNTIKRLGKNRTVILSSHILPEVSSICERVIIINQGKIVASDTPENLSKMITGETKLLARVAGEENAVLDAIREIEGVISAQAQGSKEEGSVDILVECEKDVDIRKVLTIELTQKDMPVLLLQSVEMSLEDIFLSLTDKNEQVPVIQSLETEENEETEQIVQDGEGE